MTVLPLVKNLCKAFDEEGVLYCHWKSNDAISLSESGENDLDLLVDRGSLQLFTEILYRHGFIEARRSMMQLPGILDYYGYDRGTGKIIHVHAHYMLVLGHDLIKNYHIPVEKPFVDSAEQHEIFKIPAPEFEFIIFTIRMVLKYSTWDVVIRGRYQLPPSARRELAYLESKVDPARLFEVLEEHLPCISVPLFKMCLQTLQPDCGFLTRIKTGNRLQKSLEAHTRYGPGAALVRKYLRWFSLGVQRRIIGLRARKYPAGGGLLVAIIGGDGAGKTTAINNLYKWLSPRLSTKKFHLGKPSWSILTKLIRGLLKIGRVLGFYPFVRVSVEDIYHTDKIEFPGYPWLIRRVCTARDRYLAYKKARQYANKNNLVICDRYPLPFGDLMDGIFDYSIIDHFPSNRLVRCLVRLEKHFYKQIMLPDLLCVLKLDPEIAVSRKDDEDEKFVRARNQLIYAFDWENTPAHVIDASQTEDVVISKLRRIIWFRL